MNKFILTIISIALVWAPLTSAAPTCEESLLIPGSPEFLHRLVFSSYEKQWQDGLGPRGFMGAAIPLNPDTQRLAQEYGLTWWGVRFFVVPTLEEAIAHRRKLFDYHHAKGSVYTDTTTQGLYILGDESELGIKFDKRGKGKLQKKISSEVGANLILRGAYEITPEGETHFITPEQMQRRLDPNNLTFHNVANRPTSQGRNPFTQSGWVTFKEHGIHDYGEWKDSGSAKKLMKLARRLQDRGFTIRFNHNYELCLNKLRDQVRSFRSSPDASTRENHDVEQNRFRDKSVYDTALERLQAGDGYSVEVYNEHGELVGGEIGYRLGNEFSGDSVFYSEEYSKEKDGFDGVDLAKMGTLALFEVLDQQGMPYSDPEMVTPYTASLGGKLIPFPEFREKMKSGPTELIELPKTFDLRSNDYLDTIFSQLARNRSQALTRLGFVSRGPVVDATAKTIAAQYGVQPGNLKVVVVLDPQGLEAIKAMVGQMSQPEDIPLFVIPSQAVLPEGVMNPDTLRALLASDSGIKIISFNHPRYADDFKMIAVDKLMTLLDATWDSTVRSEDLATSTSGPHRMEFSLSGWVALKK